MWRWAPRFHHQLTGGNRLAARRTRSRVAEQPAGTIRTLARLNFYFPVAYMHAFCGIGALGSGGIYRNLQRISSGYGKPRGVLERVRQLYKIKFKSLKRKSNKEVFEKSSQKVKHSRKFYKKPAPSYIMSRLWFLPDISDFGIWFRASSTVCFVL